MADAHFNLFTYGTLQRGAHADALLHGCERLGTASVRGTLYNIDDQFPALMLYGETVIHGTVWRCPAAALSALDAYEDIAGGLFRRVATNVVTEHDSTITHVPCWLYVAGPRLAHRLTPATRLQSSWQQT